MAKLIKAALFGLLIGMVGVVISIVLSRSFEEDVGLGLLFQLRGVRPPPADVVMIGIDHDSSAHFNVLDDPDEWPRFLYARLTERLVQAGARVIIFDVNFWKPDRRRRMDFLKTRLKKPGM